MSMDTGLILTVGRYIRDPRVPEERIVRMEEYLTALSGELEELYIRTNRLLRELDRRMSALEMADKPGVEGEAT